MKKISEHVLEIRSRTRGQVNIKTVTSIIIGLVVLITIFLFFRSAQEVQERAETVEIFNLKTSIETKILQQSVRPKGTVVNFSVAVPSSVSKVCFFDANKEYDSLRNPEITDIYSDDKVNNLIILTDNGFLQYPLRNLIIPGGKNPLCVNIVDNKITLRFVSEEQKTRIGASEETEDIKCISVIENGDSGKKIDIVFLGYGFWDIEEYNNQVNRYINNILLEFEPFKKYSSKFNFYRIDDAEIECEINNFIQCDQFKLKLVASDCPSDYIVVLVARSVLKDFVNPIRSSAIGNIVKINIADKPFVMVHEFGHSFADLADEYVDEGYYTDTNFNAVEYANCDSSPCSSWGNLENTSCYEGCSLNRYFRPTKSSVMRSLSSPIFGPVNEQEILKRLLYYE